MKGPKPDYAKIEEVKRLHSEGLSRKQIATKMNINPMMVTKYAHDAGIKAFFTTSTFDPDIPAMMLGWFKDKFDKLKEEIAPEESEDGKKKKTVKREVLDLPTYQMFCIEELHILPSRMKAWIDKGRKQKVEGVLHSNECDYREMVDAFDVCQDIYENMLIKGALNFKFQPVFAMFVAKNKTSLKDVKAIDFTDTVKKESLNKESMNKKTLDELKSIIEIDQKDIDEITPKQAISVMKLYGSGHD